MTKINKSTGTQDNKYVPQGQASSQNLGINSKIPSAKNNRKTALGFSQAPDLSGEIKQIIAPDRLFDGVLQEPPKHLTEENQVQSWFKEFHNLRNSYSDFSKSLRNDQETNLAKLITNIENKMPKGTNPSDKASLTMSIVLGHFSKDNTVQAESKNTLAEFQKSLYKVLELQIEPQRITDAEKIMEKFNVIKQKAPELQAIVDYINAKENIFEKLNGILPEMFKNISDSNLKNENRLRDLQEILELSSKLPARFKNTVQLDSSGKSFNEVTQYRTNVLNNLIAEKSPQNQESLIETLRTDIPSQK